VETEPAAQSIISLAERSREYRTKIHPDYPSQLSFTLFCYLGILIARLWKVKPNNPRYKGVLMSLSIINPSRLAAVLKSNGWITGLTPNQITNLETKFRFSEVALGKNTHTSEPDGILIIALRRPYPNILILGARKLSLPLSGRVYANETLAIVDDNLRLYIDNEQEEDGPQEHFYILRDGIDQSADLLLKSLAHLFKFSTLELINMIKVINLRMTRILRALKISYLE